MKNKVIFDQFLIQKIASSLKQIQREAKSIHEVKQLTFPMVLTHSLAEVAKHLADPHYLKSFARLQETINQIADIQKNAITPAMEITRSFTEMSKHFISPHYLMPIPKIHESIGQPNATQKKYVTLGVAIARSFSEEVRHLISHYYPKPFSEIYENINQLTAIQQSTVIPTMRLARSLSSTVGHRDFLQQIPNLMDTFHSSLSDIGVALEMQRTFKQNPEMSLARFEQLGRLQEVTYGFNKREHARIDTDPIPTIITLHRQAYSEASIFTGFDLSISTVSSTIFHLLERLENELRSFISNQLHLVSGEHWEKHRIPDRFLSKWQNRQDTYRKRKGHSPPLIYFSNFSDLFEIIYQDDNWNGVFQNFFMKFFLSQKNFEHLFRNLVLIRNDISHFRRLDQDDQMIFFAYTCLILRALGVAELRNNRVVFRGVVRK